MNNEQLTINNRLRDELLETLNFSKLATTLNSQLRKMFLPLLRGPHEAHGESTNDGATQGGRTVEYVPDGQSHEDDGSQHGPTEVRPLGIA